MIIAHHVILTGYGHWLPNDPRGSLSKAVRKPDLKALGEIHYGRKRTQPSSQELRRFYAKAQPHLQFPLLWFEGPAVATLGEAFGQVVRTEKFTCYACAVMRNHAHLLIRRHRVPAQEMIESFKSISRRALVEEGLAPENHPVWSRDPYVAYKDTPRAVWAALKYIAGNFRKHGIPPQQWDFVVPYDNWPFHKRPARR